MFCKMKLEGCESDSEALDPDIRAFLRYLDGEAVQKLIVVSMAREWGDISSGLLCRMMRTRAFGIRGKVTAKGCVIFFPDIRYTPAQDIRNRPKDEEHGSSFGLFFYFLLLVLYQSYGMPGMLMGKAWGRAASGVSGT